jgi:uncharacterized membrane protein
MPLCLVVSAGVGGTPESDAMNSGACIVVLRGYEVLADRRVILAAVGASAKQIPDLVFFFFLKFCSIIQTFKARIRTLWISGAT